MRLPKTFEIAASTLLAATACLGWWMAAESAAPMARPDPPDARRTSLYAAKTQLPTIANPSSQDHPTETLQQPSASHSTQAANLSPQGKAYLREISPNEVQVGEVRLLKDSRSVIFPSRVAERTVPLEYALVHETGKAHEALLVTSVPAQDLQVAALLFDAVGQSPSIEVAWKKHGGEARLPLTSLLEVKDAPADTLSSSGWVYTGSQFSHGRFQAEVSGSLIALVNDPLALINHRATAGLNRDDVFFAKSENLPPEGVTVSVILRFPNKNPPETKSNAEP
jgi:hypothetical protein